jgi:hypothetical protein
MQYLLPDGQTAQTQPIKSMRDLFWFMFLLYDGGIGRRRHRQAPIPGHIKRRSRYTDPLIDFPVASEKS